MFLNETQHVDMKIFSGFYFYFFLLYWKVDYYNIDGESFWHSMKHTYLNRYYLLNLISQTLGEVSQRIFIE